MHLFVFSVDLISYLTRFEWDMAKYPIKQPLKNISEALAKVNCTPDFKMSSWGSMTFGWLWSLLSWRERILCLWLGQEQTRKHTLRTEAVDIILISTAIIMIHVLKPIQSVSIWHFIRFTRVHWYVLCTLISFIVIFFFSHILPYYSPEVFFMKLLVWH